MQARSIRSIRRLELSQAAFEAVIRYGLRGTTLEKVGEIAGVSKGVVLHHFKDKSALLEAVFRRSNSVLSMSLLRLYRHAETPYERFWAIAYANFSETIYNREVCQAWVSLLAEVPHNTMCQRVQAANNARIKSNLSHELKHFIKESKDFDTKVGLAVRVDKFSDSSIDMYVRCFTQTDSWNEWLKVKERLAIGIKEIVEKNKASFAFPSQSIYVEKK